MHIIHLLICQVEQQTFDFALAIAFQLVNSRAIEQLFRVQKAAGRPIVTLRENIVQGVLNVVGDFQFPDFFGVSEVSHIVQLVIRHAKEPQMIERDASERPRLIEVFAPIRDAGGLMRLRVADPHFFFGDSGVWQIGDGINDFVLGDAVQADFAVVQPFPQNPKAVIDPRAHDFAIGDSPLWMGLQAWIIGILLNLPYGFPDSLSYGLVESVQVFAKQFSRKYVAHSGSLSKATIYQQFAARDKKAPVV